MCGYVLCCMIDDCVCGMCGGCFAGYVVCVHCLCDVVCMLSFGGSALCMVWCAYCGVG